VRTLLALEAQEPLSPLGGVFLLGTKGWSSEERRSDTLHAVELRGCGEGGGVR